MCFVKENCRKRLIGILSFQRLERLLDSWKGSFCSRSKTFCGAERAIFCSFCRAGGFWFSVFSFFADWLKGCLPRCFGLGLCPPSVWLRGHCALPRGWKQRRSCCFGICATLSFTGYNALDCFLGRGAQAFTGASVNFLQGLWRSLTA